MAQERVSSKFEKKRTKTVYLTVCCVSHMQPYAALLIILTLSCNFVTILCCINLAILKTTQRLYYNLNFYLENVKYLDKQDKGWISDIVSWNHQINVHTRTERPTSVSITEVPGVSWSLFQFFLRQTWILYDLKRSHNLFCFCWI